MSTISFQGQVAIVTGAGRGLGQAYALELARRGAIVVINDVGRTEAGTASADQVVAEIEALGGQALASNHDISTAEGGQSLVEATVERFGQVDVLINNAGFLRPSPFENMQVDDVYSVVDVHLLGAFHVTLPAWKVMRERSYGRIIMTSSSSSFGQEGNSNYSAAKSALLGLTRTLSLEGQRRNIQVNSILPLSDSKISSDAPRQSHKNQRLIDALEGVRGRRPPMSVAHLVVYLVSKECAITGYSYSAAAGRYARVFLGVSPGWLAANISTVSAETIREHIDEINDVAHFSIPESAIGEIEDIIARLRA